MLIEFRVENHRSLRDEQVLTMEAGRVGDEADPRPRQVRGSSERLLPVAALYGANASGKSNVLSGLAFMREAVLSSHRLWSPDEGVPRDPFAWGTKRNESSLFEIAMLIEDVRYQYGFVASDDSFLEEWLYAWPNGKKQVWFEREENVFKFGDHLKGENKLLEEVTRTNALYLSVAAQHNHIQLTPIFGWFSNLQLINLHVGRFTSLSWSRMPISYLFDQEADSKRRGQPSAYEPLLVNFRTLLRSADLGIVDFRVVKKETNESIRSPMSKRFEVQHRSQIEEAWLPLEEESRGTQNLFQIAFPFLQALQIGGVLLIDELEASMHPSLAQQIVRQFNDPVSNPLNAQLIFTTHDTNLLGTTLGEPTLRRDQVWLTEKNTEGATVLYPLTDYKPRKNENLERGYLQGRYGAIPFLGNFRVNGE